MSDKSLDDVLKIADNIVEEMAGVKAAHPDENTDHEDEDNNTGHVSMHEDLPLLGATSFDELEAAEELAEKTGLVKLMMKRVLMMGGNIISSALMSTDEKVSALGGLMTGLQSRVSGATSGSGHEIEKHFDGKMYHYIVGDTKFSSTLPKTDKEIREKVARVLEKQETKRERGVDFPAGDFADVPDREKPSTWKLRLAEGSPGNITVSQVARAITALQPSGFRGERVQLGSPKATVISKINSAIGKTGGTDEQKANLRRRLNAVKGLRSGFKVLKALDGTPRWLGWVSNNRLDRQGEILTEEAHLDYIAFLDENPKAAPELWTWHIPGTAREKRADFWAYLNGFLLLGGALTDGEAKAIESIDIDPAMSHGFYVLNRSDNLINKYRTVEVTFLPRSAAANTWTEFTTLKEQEAMKKLTGKRRILAVEVHGEEMVAALEQETGDKADLLDELKVQSKAEPDEKPVDEMQTIGDLASQVAKMVIKELNPDGLQLAIKTLLENGRQNEIVMANFTKRLEQLEKSDDEKIAEQYQPAIGIDWGMRASQSEKTVVEKDAHVLQKKPSSDWDWVGGFNPRTQGVQQ